MLVAVFQRELAGPAHAHLAAFHALVPALSLAAGARRQQIHMLPFLLLTGRKGSASMLDQAQACTCLALRAAFCVMAVCPQPRNRGWP